MSHIRDRFDDLQKLHCEEEMEKGDKKKKTMEKTAKEYLDKCEDIMQKINHIRDDSHDVNDILLHKQFDRLQDLQGDINPIIKRSEEASIKINNKLKDMSITREDLELKPTTETKMKYMQYVTLREKFQDAINSQMECIKRYEVFLEEFKKKILQSLLGENYIETEENINESQAFIGNYLLEKHAADDVQEKQYQLLIIEKQLTDLRDLFVKITILAEQQKESVNRVEHHVIILSDIVENANEELKAVGKKQEANKNKIYLPLIGIILACKIVFLIFRSYHH